MAKLFTDLSYNDKTLNPIGRPVDDLKALYKKKEQDYNYVVDSLNSEETALNKLPYHEKDVAYVDKAKQKFKEAFDTYSEEGDFENRKLDTKTLAHDLANKYGLSEVQRIAQEKSGYIQGLKERLNKPAEDGGISLEDYKRAISDAESKYQGLQHDAETGAYTGTYSGRDVLNKFNFSERVADVLKGFKSDTIVLQTKDGSQIVKDPSGTGYLVAGTKTSVSEAELINSAKSYLTNDSDFQDRIQDDLYYEKNNLLSDYNGEKRSMTYNDVENILGSNTSTGLLNSLGIKGDTKNIEKALEATGKSPEALYDAIREDQMVNSTLQLGVDKEGFEQYSSKYLNPIEPSKGTGAGGFGLNTVTDYGILHSYYTEDSTSTEDLEKTSKIYNEALTAISSNKKLLADLAADETTHPDDAKRVAENIQKSQRIVDVVNQRLSKVIEETPAIKASIDNIFTKKGDGDGNSMTSLVTSHFGDTVPYLNANRETVKSIVYKMLSGDVPDEELGKYLNVPDDVAEGGVWSKESYEAKAVRDFRTQLNKVVRNVKDASENNEVKYTKEFKTFNLPELPAKQRQSNPVYQLNEMASNLPTADSNYYQGLSTTFNGLDVETQIEQQYDVDAENGDIVWEKGKVRMSVDSSVDVNTGNYEPTLVLQVPIKKGDTTKTIQVPVHYNEPSYKSRYQEALNTYKESLLNKQKAGRLDNSEKAMLDRVNTNLYNTSKFAKELDLLNLHTAQHGESIPFEFWNDLNTTIEVSRTNELGDKSYYLTAKEDNETKYFVFDEKGEQKLVTKEELKKDFNLRAMAADTPADLKKQFSNIIYNNELDKKGYNVEVSDTLKVDTYFETDTKGTSLPNISKKYEGNVKALSLLYPGLIVTDGLRPSDVDYGAEDSKHKIAEALDFRLNSDSLKLTKLSSNELNKLGIKNASVHNGNHVHLEFL